jgi:predicted Zn-dependent protease with MMP-like domain
MAQKKKKSKKAAGPAAELEQAYELLERGKIEMALASVAAAIAAGARGDDLSYAHYLRGACFTDAGDMRKALAAWEAGLGVAPSDPVLLAARGEALFNLWEFAAAEAALEDALARFGEEEPGHDPHLAHAERHLALCLDRRGERTRAERHFARAHALDPESWPLPVRVARADFDRLARAAIESLPRLVTQKLGDVGFLVEDYPRQEQLADRPEDADPQTLGLFYGTDVGEQAAARAFQPAPNHILLFQRNLEQFVPDRAVLDDEIRTTIYHEVGHYLGYDEEGLEKIGLA